MNEFDNLRLYQVEYFLGVCMVLADIIFLHTPGLIVMLSGGTIALFSVIIGICYFAVAVHSYTTVQHTKEAAE